MMVMQKGSSNLTATVWKDKRLVHHLTTCSQPTLIQDATRCVGQHRVALRQPDSVHQYNKFMGGVDQHDQLRMAYDVGRNSKKWWRYLFWFFVNSAMVNAFILYRDVSRRRVSKKRFTHLDFCMELARGIIGGFTSRKRRMSNKENVGTILEDNLNGHVFTRMGDKKRVCAYCKTLGGPRKETRFGCAICNVYLCRGGCHARFHNLHMQ